MGAMTFRCDTCRQRAERGWTIDDKFVCPACNAENQQLAEADRHAAWVKELVEERRAARRAAAGACEACGKVEAER